MRERFTQPYQLFPDTGVVYVPSNFRDDGIRPPNIYSTMPNSDIVLVKYHCSLGNHTWILTFDTFNMLGPEEIQERTWCDEHHVWANPPLSKLQALI